MKYLSIVIMFGLITAVCRGEDCSSRLGLESAKATRGETFKIFPKQDVFVNDSEIGTISSEKIYTYEIAVIRKDRDDSGNYLELALKDENSELSTTRLYANGGHSGSYGRLPDEIPAPFKTSYKKTMRTLEQLGFQALEGYPDFYELTFAKRKIVLAVKETGRVQFLRSVKALNPGLAPFENFKISKAQLPRFKKPGRFDPAIKLEDSTSEFLVDSYGRFRENTHFFKVPIADLFKGQEEGLTWLKENANTIRFTSLQAEDYPHISEAISKGPFISGQPVPETSQFELIGRALKLFREGVIYSNFVDGNSRYQIKVNEAARLTEKGWAPYRQVQITNLESGSGYKFSVEFKNDRSTIGPMVLGGIRIF